MRRKKRRLKKIYLLVCCVVICLASVMAAWAATGNAKVYYYSNTAGEASAKSVVSKLSAIGYSAQAKTLPAAFTAKKIIKSSKVVVFVCHGDAGTVVLQDGEFTAKDISSADSFSVCKLVYFNCCETALNDSDGNNLCSTLVSKGVDCVIGFKKSIGFNSSKIFTDYFFDYAAIQGNNTGSALSYAMAKTYKTYTDVQSAMLFGDGATIIR